METLIFDFTRGINTILDKAIAPDGYASVLDNVDLRSGQARPVLGPVQYALAASDTVQIFRYRGRVLETKAPNKDAGDTRKYSYRSYVARMEKGSERIYWSEYGSRPQKMVDGTQANLGTLVPKVPPTVTRGDTIVPMTVTLTAGAAGTGVLTDSTYSYRISATQDGSILPPSQAYYIKPPNGGSVTVSWVPVAAADGYIVWGRVDGNEQILARINDRLTTSWMDDGRGLSEGDYAGNYENKTPISYAYSYVRSVNGMLDEGGLSLPSPQLSQYNTRRVTRNPNSDGFYDENSATYLHQSVAGLADNATIVIQTTANDYASITINSAQTYQGSYTQFTCAAPHGLTSGDSVCIGILGYSVEASTFKVNVVSPTVFAVQGMRSIPTGMTFPASATPCKCRITLGAAPAGGISTGDSITVRAQYYMNGITNPVWGINGTYKAKVISPTVIEIPVLNSVYYAAGYSLMFYYTVGSLELKWVPNNGYYKYWNLYRTGDTGEYLLVKQLDIDTDYFDDTVPPVKLGRTPDGYYTVFGSSVLYEPPPLGLDMLTEHYGMLFGIDGNRVRWTPVDRPDAWPEVFSTPPFQHRPVALVSYDRALIILCLDGPYRLDGQNPATLSLTNTPSKDGCVAPHSVQVVNGHLIYLSARGLVAFNGADTVCITEGRLNPSFFFGGSTFADGLAHNFWWQKTTDTHNYANLASPTEGTDLGNAQFMSMSESVDLPIREIASFSLNGKYYLYWIRSPFAMNGGKYTNFSAHTALVMDMQATGRNGGLDAPITTMGMQALWVTVDEMNQPFALFDNAPGSIDTWDKFMKGQTSFNLSTPYVALNSGVGTLQASANLSANMTMVLGGRAIYKLFADQSTRVPAYIRTGPKSCGNPGLFKRFRSIKFYGNGTIHVRAWIDGRLVINEAVLTASGAEIGSMRMCRFPRGSRGYTVDVEAVGDANFRLLGVEYEAAE